MFREEFNEMKIKRVCENLKKRNMNGYFCNSTDELFERVLKIMEGAKTVSFGGSLSLIETGVMDLLETENGNRFTLIDRRKAKTPEETREIQLKALGADCYFMSTNAVSEDGILVNIDGMGNRVAALCYGPKKVIMICGVNKITSTIDEALLRARTHAAPLNAMRLETGTPCNFTGQCADCQAPKSICSQFVFTRRSQDPDRIHVIFINENYGL